MSDPTQALRSKLQFWEERAKGFEQRIDAWKNGLNAELAQRVPGAEPSSSVDDALIATFTHIEQLNSQLNTLRGYLFAVVEAASAFDHGGVTVTDELLQRAMQPDARLKITAPKGGTYTRFAAVRAEAPPTIVTPENKIILPP